MLDWTKLLNIKMESEEDAPRVIRELAETMPDNMLLSLLKKSKERGHSQLIPYLEEEKKKRGL